MGGFKHPAWTKNVGASNVVISVMKSSRYRGNLPAIKLVGSRFSEAESPPGR